MTLTINSIIHSLIDNNELELAQSFITIKKHPAYATALDNIFAITSPFTKELSLMLGNSESSPPTPTQLPPTSEKVTTYRTNKVVNGSTEVYLLSDFRNPNSKSSVDKTNNNNNILSVEYRKLKPEHKMVLLTIAWANRPSTSSFIIKHCQRLSCYFGLDQDERWRSYYDNNRTKMQSLITNTISKYKKSGVILETKMSTLSKHSVYHLSNLGVSLSRMIADEVGFSLDSAI